jgi:hypothetical protein
VNFEAIDPWRVSFVALWRDEGGVNLKENVVKRGTKIGAIDGCMARGFGVVDIFTLGTVELDCFKVRVVRLPHRQQSLGFTHDSRALAKIVFLVLFKLSYGQKHCYVSVGSLNTPFWKGLSL